MAELTKDMSHDEIAAHLRDEVCGTARRETGRLVTGRDPALFGAVRGVMCDLDYVAALYYGWNRKRRDKVATKRKSVRFLRQVMAPATGDSGYRDFAQHLYDLYRCGVVHLRAPKLLKSPHGSTKALTWALMYPRKGSLEVDGQELELEHLKLLRRDASLTYLPLSIKALFDDFLATCEHIAEEAEAERDAKGSALRSRWRQTANALVEAEPTGLRW